MEAFFILVRGGTLKAQNTIKSKNNNEHVLNMQPPFCATTGTGSEILLQKIKDFRQMLKPLEKISGAFLLAPTEQKVGRKTGDAPRKKHMAIVVPYILLASGKASAGRVPAPPEDTSVN